jgi:hypothetical protein
LLLVAAPEEQTLVVEAVLVVHIQIIQMFQHPSDRVL